MRQRPAGPLAVLLLAATTACATRSETPESERRTALAEPAPISWTHFEVPDPSPAGPDRAARGGEVYAANCASCHGETGEGDGRCAEFLEPPPRNLTSGVFRFKTTPGAEAPTDQDLFRTVSLGLHGTGMPPWRYLLSETDRWAVVAYLRSLVPPTKAHATGAEPVSLGGEPGQISPGAVARGRQLYADAGCGDCHGAQGYGDGPSADTLEDSFGRPIQPRNFHKADHFKRGHTLRDVALTITTGNNGTPMPSFADALEPEQVWDLAAYVLSLADRRPPADLAKSTANVGESLGEPDVVVKLAERSWRYSPSEIRVRQGQVVRIELQPTDNGLGAGHGFAIDGYDKDVFINGAMVQRPKSVTFVAGRAGTFSFYCATQCSTGTLHPSMTGTLIVEPVDGGVGG